LIGGPKLLLLDEPARGLDAPLRESLYQVLRQVRSEFNVPILLVTHDLDECFTLGDEMLVLREGRIVRDEATGLYAPGEQTTSEFEAMLRDSSPEGPHA
jgi:ABC-type sulfate/molybdate transport systems ATPase subunit